MPLRAGGTPTFDPQSCTRGPQQLATRRGMGDRSLFLGPVVRDMRKGRRIHCRPFLMSRILDEGDCSNLVERCSFRLVSGLNQTLLKLLLGQADHVAEVCHDAWSTLGPIGCAWEYC